ncbi:hypothetical protein IFM89_022793 [Coptis chinensis]|uniref:Mitochondrial carrier protein n=1 Tax=Coptis chinensis TaxID=261450 RepID=A0A835I769_9MAGN|nr:hypothetical protein IFM89_022793 [Coptis chinensis]
MLAGLVAGMVEHMAMFPVDTHKTRMQMLGTISTASLSAHRHNTGKVFTSIMRKEGPLGFYCGIGAIGLGAGLAHAVLFHSLRTMKKVLSEISLENASEEQILVHLTAGGAAGVLASAVTTPLDVVKTRLQCRVAFMAIPEWSHWSDCPTNEDEDDEADDKDEDDEDEDEDDEDEN